MEEEKATALAQMKQAVRDLGSSTDNYLDGNLMRFLIARSMVPEKAAKMFVQWQEWRASFVPLRYIPYDEVRDQLEERKMFLGGITKEGSPLILVKACRHNSLSKDKLQLKKFIVHFLDKAIASAYKGGQGIGNEKIMAAVDLGQLMYKNIDLPGFIIGFQLLQSYYPERLGKCYMLNTAWFLANMWKMISYFLDKATQEKVVFVYSEEEKKEFIEHLGEDLVPEEFGGKAKLVALQDVTI